ncbi:proton-conducting transporter membrane subunit [Crenothrix polyspora]|uniref:NADH-quinone oxidoreductase subunit L n=1 Tax=Crenothrix polyspora TaxID=360316 RepID=A0A1R4GZ04_9GAMM|nr:proton-conducting transporter membrane subunit [Crenothrix polyspora]SJM89198.1 NADH-quinone oxidoreductase subunit L [Crenothrix polyspora]
MNGLILACQLIPLLGFVLVFLSPNNEKVISTISNWITHLTGVSIIALLALWVSHGFQSYEYVWFSLYETADYHFPILFYLDRVGAVYLVCVWIIFSIITKYCRYYLHRETGYKRFFLNIFGFLFGLNLIILSGSIDMLFAGWEIVGISSFMLIAFYRHRVQPVRNALRAYTIYRFCDIGLLLGTWMSHMLFHESPHFSQMASLAENNVLSSLGYGELSLLTFLIIIAASGKSAQFPFCFWLPRAMEGPTPSSAIFYGALSVHLGVFLLLRTDPIWSYHVVTRAIIFFIGLLTVIIASLAEKTQSNIKGQIAYASITQVGLMFIELSLGLDTLVLLHFMGNAFLRCYQLLVSPSIITHLLRVEGAANTDFYIEKNPMRQFLPLSIRNQLPEVLQNTLYVFALQEGGLEFLVRSLLWTPFKRIGGWVNALNVWWLGLMTLTALGGGVLIATNTAIDHKYLAIPVSIAMIIASSSAFSQKHSPFKVWNSILLSYILSGVAVLLINPHIGSDVLMFFSGILPSWLLGIIVLSKLLKNQHFEAAPFAFRAMAETQPKLSLLLFISFLGLVGFPITPAFLSEDILLAHASSEHPWFALPITIAFVVNGIAAARVYMGLCMGRPNETYTV